MANTYITSTSRFKPYTFAEMLQPVQIYTEAYNKLEDELSNLDVLAGDVAGKLNNPKDKELADKALAFQTELNNAMNSFYSKGLNADTRKQLAGLKARYTKELNPINEAYKLYQEDQKYLAKMAIEHPEILIEGAGSSISDYMGGKTPQMMSVNADDLMNQAMTIAKTQSGRTYKQSKWSSTAGGRFLERYTETGLNDIDFNNALAFVQNPKLTAEDLDMTNDEFNKVKSNASLINDSIEDIINSPSFVGLSESNKKKALNSIIKGVRAGFQYDKKIETESDPMFAYNLKKREDEEKAKAKRAEQAGMIGSDYFLTPNETKTAHRNTFTNTLGKDAGKLDKFYEKYFKEGKLITREEAQKEASKLRNNTPIWNTTSGPWAPAATPSLGYGSTSYMTDYDGLVGAFNDLGLDINTATKEDFLEALNTDVQGRRRASITSNDSGFKVIQSNLEAGLKNQEKIQEVKGLKKGDDGISRYRTEGVDIKDLYDNKGNLNILRINMDYHTGERTVMIKTPKGDIREFIIPDGASHEAEDPRTLANITANIREVSQGYKTGYVKKGGKVIEVQIPLTPEEQAAELNELYTNANLIFGDMFNIFGANTIN